MDGIQETKSKMQKALAALQEDIATVRTGRAMPSLVENIVVTVYGGTQRMKIKEIATIAVSDPQTLVLQPYDASIEGEIQKGIMEANIGLTPSSDGNLIRIKIPVLSEDRRKDLIRLMKQKIENGKIAIRQIRQDARNDVRKLQLEKEISEEEMYRSEKEIQGVTDEMMVIIEELGNRKEQELMQI